MKTIIKGRGKDMSKKIDDIKYWAMVNHQGIYPSVSFSKSEFDWLIEQAEKVERYEKALKFYADKENYYVYENNLDPTVDYINIIDMDEGDKARKALKD